MVCSLLCKNKSVSIKPNRIPSNYGVKSITGWKPAKSDWVNQDSYVFFEDSREGTDTKNQIYAVLDGHGPDGHKVSGFCREKLKLILPKVNCIEHVFDQMQKELCECSIDIENSGTTCSIIIVENKSLKVYNIGDSKAILARRTSTNGKLSAITLTEDHKPDIPEEAERIKRCGGEVYSSSTVSSTTGQSSKTGPLRVWFPCKKTSGLIGLAMTRSWGDASAHKVGVISEPYQQNINFQDDDEFIILASDGIWDVIPNAVEIVDSYISSLPPIKNKSEWDPQEAASRLVVYARKLWKSNSYIDDITCFIIRLK